MKYFLMGRLIIVVVAIIFVCMIAAGCQEAIKSAHRDADIRIEIANRQIPIKARKLAEKMYREKLQNTVITVSQEVVVVEDDLGQTESIDM